MSMDPIVDLPRTQKDFDNIFVVVDILTKVAQSIPTTIIVTILGVVVLFLK
jgi:hypothetical protein